MVTITPHLWFDREAVEAAEFYASTFPDSRVFGVTTLPDTPSGDTDVVSFELWGQPFAAISAGPFFEFKPSLSFLVACDTAEEVDRLWDRLAEDGNALMPLGSYPFSDQYGWTEDRYGLSWQVMLTDGRDVVQRITPALMFVGDVRGSAEEAVGFYTSIFPDSKVGELVRYGPADEPDEEGTVKFASFQLGGQQFAAMDSAQAPQLGFNESVSLMVGCDTQDEIDHYWEGLSAVPEAEQCGWLKDRYGLSWQVVPTALDEFIRTGTEQQVARVTQAFLAMKKFDLAALQRAYEGSS